MPAAITIADLSYIYPTPLPDQEPTPALHHINLTIERGQFVALIGPVGAGKTTLCLSLNGLIPQVAGGDYSGQVIVDGLDTLQRSVADIARHVGIVFEDAEVQLFNASVEDEIAFGLEELGWSPAAIEERIDWALGEVGLDGFRTRSPRTLSGGEQKRLAIATVLAVAPPIFVLDEPTAGLDPLGKQGVMDVVAHLVAERQSTIIMASQDPEIVARYADRVILLDEGEVILEGSPAELYSTLTRESEVRVGIPEMAVVSRLLAPQIGLSSIFLTPEDAHAALRERVILDRKGHSNAAE